LEWWSGRFFPVGKGTNQELDQPIRNQPVIDTAYLDASGVMRLVLANKSGLQTALHVWDEADDLVTVTQTYTEACTAPAAAKRSRALTESGLGRALRSWDALRALVAPSCWTSRSLRRR
jgi:hypothetical protein